MVFNLSIIAKIFKSIALPFLFLGVHYLYTAAFFVDLLIFGGAISGGEENDKKKGRH